MPYEFRPPSVNRAHPGFLHRIGEVIHERPNAIWTASSQHTRGWAVAAMGEAFASPRIEAGVNDEPDKHGGGS